jgi:hypothetical protein
VIGAYTREAMRKILADIQSGEFAKEWIAENRAGQENFKRMRKEGAARGGTGGPGATADDGVDRGGRLASRLPLPTRVTTRLCLTIARCNTAGFPSPSKA